MSTGDFLEKTKQEVQESKAEGVNPLITIKEEEKIDRLKIYLVVLLFSYIVIGYLFYDYFKNKSKLEKIEIIENFIDIDSTIKKLESNLVNIDLVKNEVSNEEEIIKNLADKSINLPPIKEIINQPLPNNVEIKNQTTQKPIITSRYDFFISQAKEYEDIGNLRYAIFFYLRAFAENPNDYEIKYKIATLYYKLGQLPLAIESAKDALAIKDDYLPAIEFLINIFNMNYEVDGLEDILKKALNKYPNDKNIILTLAKIYKKNNNIEEYNKLMAKLKEQEK